MAILLWAGAAGCLLAAQVPGITTIRIAKGDPTSDAPASNGWYRLIENDARTAMQALIAEYQCTSKKTGASYNIVTISDSLYAVNYGDGLPPGERGMVSAADPGECAGDFEAAIFADGRTEGEQKGIEAIYAKRRGAFKAIEAAIRVFDRIAGGTEKQDQGLEELRSFLSVSQRDPLIEPREKDGLVAIYQIGITELQVPALLREPEVDRVMISQNLNRVRAYATVVTRMLKQWQASLQSHPPLRQSQQ